MASCSGGSPISSTRPSTRRRGRRALRSGSAPTARGEGEAIEILQHTFVPIAVPHGTVTSYGFRVGGLGYVTDGKLLPEATLAQLSGVDVLVLNALWFGDPHPTHFNIEEAVAAAEAVGARMTYLTHLTHRVAHRELVEWLPDGIEPAYDGLTVTVRDAPSRA